MMIERVPSRAPTKQSQYGRQGGATGWVGVPCVSERLPQIESLDCSCPVQ